MIGEYKNGLMCVLVVVLTAGHSCSQNANVKAPETDPDLRQALQLITPQSLEKGLSKLASDEFEGRNSGYPGEEKATEYIARHFEQIGLKPMGDVKNGKRVFFQAFEFVPRRPPSPTPKIKSRNVLGFVEGSDEKLKSQVVVIGAHHDGQGKEGQADPGRITDGNVEDKIWNSADDNASGTAVLMEIAAAVMKARIRTKRSILFISFGAEEHGLFGEEALLRPGLPRLGGSEYYAANPAFELERHFAMINLEMIGRSPETEMEARGTSTGSMWPSVIRKVTENFGGSVVSRSALDDCCDNYPFGSRKIPAIMFGVPGDREHYHRRSDHADRIAYDHLTKRSRFILALLVELANY